MNNWYTIARGARVRLPTPGPQLNLSTLDPRFLPLSIAMRPPRATEPRGPCGAAAAHASGARHAAHSGTHARTHRAHIDSILEAQQSPARVCLCGGATGTGTWHPMQAQRSAGAPAAVRASTAIGDGSKLTRMYVRVHTDARRDQRVLHGHDARGNRILVPNSNIAQICLYAGLAGFCLRNSRRS